MRQYCTYNRQSISVGSLYNKEQYNGSQIFLLAMILQLVSLGLYLLFLIS